MYFNLIGKYNVLYLIQSLHQIERDDYSLWIEMKAKKENLRFRLYFKKFLVD